MNITADSARTITKYAKNETLKLEMEMEKQLNNVEIDIYQAANSGKSSVKTALLYDDLAFFEELTRRLQKLGFNSLHFLSVDVNGDASAILEIKW